jgi:hypothetical protein
MGKTIPVYFGEDEEDLYEKIDKISKQKHISRSSCVKMIIAESIDSKEQDVVNNSKNNKPINNFSNLLDEL